MSCVVWAVVGAGCAGTVDLTDAPIEVCSRVNLLSARAEIAEARRHAAYFSEVGALVSDAEQIYREGEWAQQRGECEISSQKGLDAVAKAKEGLRLSETLGARLSAPEAIARAQADVEAARPHVDSALSKKAAKHLGTAQERVLEAARESHLERARRLALDASAHAASAWRLSDLAGSGRIDSEMEKAKIFLDEAEKKFAAAEARGMRATHPAEFAQAELWLKVARFDVEENDPPEVAEFSRKALGVLAALEPATPAPTPARGP